MLKVVDLHKAFHHLGQTISVLRGVNFEVAEGESLAVVGASGVGKSTLLHCLGLNDHIDQGSIWIAGEEVARPGSLSGHEKLSDARRKKIGFVFQFHYLMAELTALENVMVPLLLAGKAIPEASEAARVWLDRVGLSHRLQHKPAELSGGEQQRVAIARALVHGPKVILADEPTGNLDPETAVRVFDVLVNQCVQTKSILIMATHNLELAKRLSRSAILQKGVLVS